MALLLKHGADTAAVNKQGETALFSACEEAGEEGPSPLALDAVLFLLEQGAGCGIVASDGTTVRCQCRYNFLHECGIKLPRLQFTLGKLRDFTHQATDLLLGILNRFLITSFRCHASPSY